MWRRRSRQLSASVARSFASLQGSPARAKHWRASIWQLPVNARIATNMPSFSLAMVRLLTSYVKPWLSMPWLKRERRANLLRKSKRIGEQLRSFRTFIISGTMPWLRGVLPSRRWQFSMRHNVLGTLSKRQSLCSRRRGRSGSPCRSPNSFSVSWTDMRIGAQSFAS